MAQELDAIKNLIEELLRFRPVAYPYAEGAWFGGLALRGKDSKMYLVAGELILLEKGIYPPHILPQGLFVNKPNLVLAATSILNGAETEEAVRGLIEHKIPQALQSVFGQEICLPQDTDNRHGYWRDTPPKLQVAKGNVTARVYRETVAEISDFVDAATHDKANTAVRFLDEPYSGLAEIVSQVSPTRSREYERSSRPVVSISAELPVSVDFFDYDIAVDGYRIKVSIGARISRAMLKFSMTGGLRRTLLLSAKGWERVGGDDDLQVWQYIIQSEHSKEDVSWGLALKDELLGEGKCGGRPAQFGSTSRPSIDLAVISPQVIRLPYGEWTYYPNRKLGRSGGFGEVFEGTDLSKRLLAVKRIKAGRQEFGLREIQIARELVNHELAHVIPILDAGQDNESKLFFVVMGRAQQNLQELIDRGGAVPEREAIGILQNIASGIGELGERIHRDLKPANILLHDGKWKLADLGLARVALAETSMHTVKDFKTHLYAAPEQWSGERSTKATDIYAFGCIIYALINGEPPFAGTEEELRHKHLSGRPDKPLAGSGALQVLAMRCLQKEPAARPSIGDVKILLHAMMQPSADDDPIVLAAASLAAARDKQQMLEQEAKRQQEARQRTGSDAIASMQASMNAFFDDIVEKALGFAERTNEGVQMGSASLGFCGTKLALEEKTFSKAGWIVSVGAFLELRWAEKRLEEAEVAKSFSVNLWFAKRPGDTVFRWWEMGYLRPGAGEWSVPFGTLVDFWLPKIDLVLAGESSEITLAIGPVPIDLGEEKAFLDRWRRRLAEASQSLVSPFNPSW